VEVTIQNTTTRTGAGSVATDETDRLIASNKVEGTAVSFGGFLGIGESYHPLPWRVLNYDTGMGGYVVDLDKDRLRGRTQLLPRPTPGLERPELGDARA
jgi:hypothetical protein